MLKPKTAAMAIKIEPELKAYLNKMAVKRGMDLSKLTRAILTNFVKSGTYQL